jgi:glycine C-acetyltransferase/8-amino-7-oxononanoate synthase
VRHLDATHVEVDGRRYVNFASNNYLGLSHHPRVLRVAEEALRCGGVGAGASPLVTGHTPAHESAERAIAAWKGAEACVVLPSGYQANATAVQTLASLADADESEGTAKIRFLLDKLVHASLVDAVRQSGAPFRVFPHNNLEKLSRLLAEAQAGQVQVVVTESIFSMDGDAAPLADLARIKQQGPGFILLLDEAHASGVYGPAGAGLAAHLGLGGLADVTVVTLSKALGCAGGAVCGSAAFCEAVVNLGRAYVYSTALPPALAATAEEAVGVLRDEPQHQERLTRVCGLLRSALREAGPCARPGCKSPPAILRSFRWSWEAKKPPWRRPRSWQTRDYGFRPSARRQYRGGPAGCELPYRANTPTPRSNVSWRV